ncbi:MAG: hypothetical protein AAB368_17370, partial [bacterium]
MADSFRFPALSACLDVEAEGGPEALRHAITRAADLGCTGVHLRARWDHVFRASASSADFMAADRAVGAVRAKGLAATIRLDTFPPPAWMNPMEYAALDAAGKPILSVGGGRPLLTRNSKHVR